MIANKQETTNQSALGVGQKYLEVWSYLANPEKLQVDPVLADSWCMRVSRAVADVSAAQSNAREQKSRSAETKAAKATHAVCGQMDNLITLFSDKKIAKPDLETKADELISAMESGAAQIRAQGTATDSQQNSAANVLRSAKPLPSEEVGMSAGELLRKFEAFVETSGEFAKCKSSLEKSLARISPASLKTLHAVFFEGKEYTKQNWQYHGIRTEIAKVVCAAAADLARDGKFTEKDLRLALDYLWQQQPKHGNEYWKKFPSQGWTDQMKVTSAIKRGLVSTDASGKVLIAMG